MKNRNMKLFGIVHALLMISAGVLIIISSNMVYALSQLTLIAALLGGAALLDLALAFAVKREGVVTDLTMLITTALAALALCQTILGRADLMGYVWFSDLESGNPVAVTALYLACGSMVCSLAGALMNITAGFRETTQNK